MKRNLLERLNQGPVICAEGYLFELEKRGYLSAGAFVPMVALENPDALENLHKDNQHAGSEIMLAFTYNGHREKMRSVGKEKLLESLNRAALRIAKKIADNPINNGEPNLMAGNISHSNIWEKDDRKSQLEAEKMFWEMTEWAVEEGADLIMGETFFYAEEAYKALEIIQKSGLPSVINIAPLEENIMQDGISIIDTCKELEQRGANVVGMNCFRGPSTMMPYLKKIRKEINCHMSALPLPFRTTKNNPTYFNLPDNNGCTCHAPSGKTFPTALDPMYCNRYEMNKFFNEAFELGIYFLGVCCGATPMHQREAAEAVGLTVPASKYREDLSSLSSIVTNAMYDT